MSKPMTWSKPASCDMRTMPTMPPGRTGQDRVLAAEVPGLGQPTVGLHEHQPHAAPAGPATWFDVAAQHRGQVGVDDGGVPARDQLHQRADLAGQRDLGEADPARPARRSPARAPGTGGCAGTPPRPRGSRRRRPAAARSASRSRSGARSTVPSAAIRSSTSTTRSYSSLRQHDVPVEDAGAILVGDAQRVAEAAGDHQQRALSLALQQRVGRHGGAHPHRLDLRDRDGPPSAVPSSARIPATAASRYRAGFSDSSLCVSRRPSGRRATMSVNVPPRSIQNCHPAPATRTPFHRAPTLSASR